MRIRSTASRWRLVAATSMTGLAVMLTGCAVPAVAGAPHAGEPATAAVVPAGLERFYGQQIAWGSCTDFKPSGVADPALGAVNLECGRLEVPLDYAKPDGRTAQVAVIRRKATGVKIGSLVFNFGGPGGSGLTDLAGFAGLYGRNAASQRFDLVSFDPRGVGASTPAIRCYTQADLTGGDQGTSTGPVTDPVAYVEQLQKNYVAKCVQNSGGADVLANVGTRDVARDLVVLRAALGDQKLSYVGYSYGTLIGATYAEAFPQNVRALVLDGAIDPAESHADHAVAQQAAFQKAFDAYATDCAASPNCPLGTDPAQATARFQQLTRPLVEHPAQVGDRPLYFNTVVTAVTSALYQPVNWPVLSQGLAGLTGQAGGDTSKLLLLADGYDGRESDGSFNNMQDAFTAVNCVDYERITDHAEEVALEQRAAAAAPFKDSGQPVLGALDACAFWPVPPTRVPHVPSISGLPATVVVSTTGDPATPYQSGVNLAKELGSALVTYQGTQHTVSLSGNSCVDDAVAGYLIDLTAPQPNLTCAPTTA